MKWTVLVAVAALAGLAIPAYAQSDRLAVVETGYGQIVIEFFPDDAPNHVENFVSLAESGAYADTLFHRIIPGFMIQGGDPNTISGDPGTWGMGGPGENVDAEFNDIKHARGIVSMARSADPDSAGSQFFIVHADSEFLDGQYTVFGRIVTDGSFETLDRIAQAETNDRDAPVDLEPARITGVTITDRSGVEGLLDLPEPERMQDAPEPPESEPARTLVFNSTELGVRFTAPPGWALPRVSAQPGAPDAVTLDPDFGRLPVIALRVDEHQKTFDETVSDRDVLLEDLKDIGYEILSRERDTLNGLPTYVVTVTGPNPLNPQLPLKTQEVTVYTPDKAYVFEYAHYEPGFEQVLPLFTGVLESFEIEGNDPGAGSGGCLIATAAFGSELAPQVQQLRELRDNAVLPTRSGSAFLEAFNSVYYSFSPAVADLVREHPAFRDMVRAAITPMLATLSILNHAGIDSEAEMVSYGAGVILLNVGMYVAAPAAAAYRIRRVIADRRA